MTNKRSILKNFTGISPGSRWIGGIGSARAAVLGEGEVDVLTSINGITQQRCIKNVLYAPSLEISLLSVGVITSKGADVHFIDSDAFISRDGLLEMTAARVGRDLYLLDINIIDSSSTAYVSQPFQSSLQEWHKRLAHLNYRMIIKMAKSGSVTGLHLPDGTLPPTAHCHDCAVGKMTRSSFSSSISPREARIGSLVHSDVCGPMQVKSLGGALYYVIFQDDASGFRQVRFVLHKSEVSSCFKEFVSMLNTQTGQLVATLRSDNGGEYESTDLQSWLRKKGNYKQFFTLLHHKLTSNKHCL